MKFQKLVFALPLLVSHSIFALTSDKPTTCPSVEALAAIGVSDAISVTENDAGSWVAYQPSNSFETTNKWTLIVTSIEATNARDAINQANKALPSLNLIAGPEEVKGGWGCVYASNDYSLIADAITPPLLGDLKSFIHKFNLKTVH
ncbi:DUF4949 domain-containing protein [Legionella sp. D16C41]|uniref:DUF4949 domain-containing protein n=1 Tax=Legionella sp. D16C41 TaxID=3402688 RepID=UPI003AF65581